MLPHNNKANSENRFDLYNESSNLTQFYQEFPSKNWLYGATYRTHIKYEHVANNSLRSTSSSNMAILLME
jgi:hypothetical protein